MKRFFIDFELDELVEIRCNIGTSVTVLKIRETHKYKLEFRQF